MTARRLILATVIAGVMGSSATAFAEGIGSTQETKRVCVVGTDDPTTHNWDGVCVWVPIH